MSERRECQFNKPQRQKWRSDSSKESVGGTKSSEEISEREVSVDSRGRYFRRPRKDMEERWGRKDLDTEDGDEETEK